MFSSNYNSGRWTKSRNPAILSVIQHRQNALYSTLLLTPKTKQYPNLNYVCNVCFPSSVLHAPSVISVYSATAYINAHSGPYDNYMTYELPVIMAEIATGPLDLVRALHALYAFRTILLINVMVGEISR
jgi:hypothetical protein